METPTEAYERWNRWTSEDERNLINLLTKCIITRGTDSAAGLICKSIDEAGPAHGLPINYIFKNIVAELDRLKDVPLTERPGPHVTEI